MLVARRDQIMGVPISSWGRLSADEHQVVSLNRMDVLSDGCLPSGLPFGNGRSYGDVCLNPDGLLWLTRGLDKFIAFEQQTGLLRCEAGVLLREIQQLVVPKGWMLPVTPGTQLITVGGAIANDVHGKNHHVLGSFGDHVKSLSLHRTDGEVIICGPDRNSDWFSATVGGMGLTGIVVEVTLQLRRIEGPCLLTENVSFTELPDFFALADSSENDWEHTVSWVDCLNGKGRGVFMRANHVGAQENMAHPCSGISVPIVPPISLVNKITLRPFNLVYYRLQAQKRSQTLVHYEPFFYPLDNVQNWNRIYGPKGFYQYQSVVPREVGQDAITAMLRTISAAGEGSFLAVLKTFGNRESPGMMSFPMPGVTLALDFPNKGKSTLDLLRSLDDIVSDARGRIYPAKDSRMPLGLFEKGYPRLSEFLKYRDPGISSSMSRRLMGY